jgi:hypothetical protein
LQYDNNREIKQKQIEKLRGKNLFPEKLAKANEVIVKVGLPKK